MYSIPDMILGRELKEVKKDVEVGPLPYTIVNGYGDPVAVAAPNEGVDKKRFERALAATILPGTAATFLVPGGDRISLADKAETYVPGGMKLMSKPCPVDCICSKHKGKTGIVSTVKRIGDAERDACLDLLRDRHVSGHLTLDEFEARKDKALTARNQHELDYLTQDLPASPKPVAAPEVRREHVVSFLCRVVSATFPVMAAITILMGASLAAAAVLAVVGGLAAFLLTFLRLS